MGRFIFNENQFYENLIEILEYEKKRLGTWQELADELEIDKDELLKYRKRLRFPSLKTLIKICELSGFSSDHIIFNK